MKNLFNLTELFEELLKNDNLTKLLSLQNITEDSDNTLAFKNDNAELKVENTDNGFVMSYSYEFPKKNTLKEEFKEYCDKIKDDDFFKEVCDLYTEVHGSLNDMWNNLTETNIDNFKQCVVRTAEEAMEEAEGIISEMKEIIKLTQN